jgi:hypothetical protein
MNIKTCSTIYGISVSEAEVCCTVMKLALQHLRVSALSDMKMTFKCKENICFGILKCVQTFEHTRQSFCETVT